MKKLLTGFVLAVWCGSAFGDVLIVQNSKMTMYASLANGGYLATATSPYARAWMITTFTRVLGAGFDNAALKTVASCATSDIYVMQSVYYLGNSVVSTSNHHYQMPAPPGSPAAMMLNYLCRGWHR